MCRPLRTFIIFVAWLACSAQCLANCGQAVCVVNTDWESQGVLMDAGTRFDLRFEYIDQDQPRAGSKRVSVGEISQHHDEVRTINRNGFATLDHALANGWGLSLTIPFLSRTHHHIHNHHGNALPESWCFDELGDARITGRFQRPITEASQWGLMAGLKLPTGKDDVRNDDGDLAERTLQPGTGTTDIILGGFYHRPMASADAFVQIQAQHPLNEQEEFEPGTRLSLDAGMRYPLSDAMALLVQINLLHRDRDRGDNAEPEDSGGNFVYLSPGASISFSRSTRIYGFLQLPLYQRVNGVQLTDDWAITAGLSLRF